MTFAVDWALNNNYLSIYPGHELRQHVSDGISLFDIFCDNVKSLEKLLPVHLETAYEKCLGILNSSRLSPTVSSLAVVMRSENAS